MRCLAAFFAILMLFSITSCDKLEPPTCRAVLDEMLNSEVGLPAGRIYSLRAERGHDEFLSESTINSLYGDGGVPPMREGWLDVALFMPLSSHPCELAVFLCDSSDTAKDTARLLCRRLDVIRVAKGDKKHLSLIDNAKIAVVGNYVLFIISSDSENCLKNAKKALR